MVLVDVLIICVGIPAHVYGIVCQGLCGRRALVFHEKTLRSVDGDRGLFYFRAVCGSHLYTDI